ncbi:hypothetical protein LOD99_229 [Oopsacas minuta]|uniref:Uncharacterized protein n=1 Tax=Oopsacas minuta TaxID=111878 RepID=A0AAV7K8M5_9METZ|nr:hypothetical protein LOD99_229 [Oopsacas minuta]
MATNIVQDEYDTDIYDEYLKQFLALPPARIIPPADLQFTDDITPEIKGIEPRFSYEARIKPSTDEAEKENKRKIEKEMDYKRLLCYDYPDPKDDPPEEWETPIYWINSRIDTRFLQQARFPKRRYDLIIKGYLPPIEVPKVQFYNTLHKLLKDEGFEKVYGRLVYYGFTEVVHLFDWDIEVCDYLVEDLFGNDEDMNDWDTWMSTVLDILKNYKRCVLS